MEFRCPVCHEWIKEKDYCAHEKDFQKMVKGLKETQGMLKELEGKYNALLSENFSLKRELKEYEDDGKT